MESLTWSSLDDTRSEGSYRSSGGGSGHGQDAVEWDSACSVGSPEDKEEVPTYDRVGIMADDHIAVMVQVGAVFIYVGLKGVAPWGPPLSPS